MRYILSAASHYQAFKIGLLLNTSSVQICYSIGTAEVCKFISEYRFSAPAYHSMQDVSSRW